MASFAWLNSLGTGAIANGVFFVADNRYDFSAQANLALGLTMGAVYIAGALGAGPGLRWLAARLTWLSSRGVMAAQMIGMAALCALPVLVTEPWTLWLFTLTYMPLIGSLWPIVESFISGGRRGQALRRATGVFNLSWASAVAAAYWGMAPLLERDALEVILGLAMIHVIGLLLLPLIPPEPARHVEEAHEPHPPDYVGLLHCFRWLLALSYVLLAAMSPLLPWRFDLLDVRVGWQTPIASAWMVSRVVMFVLLSGWGGWHGHWRTPVWTTALMLVGFAGVILAPDVLWMGVALAAFGVGLGGVYAGALYYAMEVGAAEVDAGGKHEALIGVGYTIGPLAGLIAWRLVDAGWAGGYSVNAVTVAVVSAVAVLGVLAAARSARRAMRSVTA